jgi:hypothetical protein
MYYADSTSVEKPDTTKKETIKYLKQGSERIGSNGFAVHALYVNQYVNDGKRENVSTGGIALSGDILTGVPYIHLFPTMKYWKNSSTIVINDTTSRLLDINNHELSLHFNAAFITSRFTSESIRLFAGLGPSMHIDIQSVYETINTVKFGETTSGVRNGLGVFAGFEWPFSVYSTLLITGSYVRTFDWDRLDRVILSFSIGLAI